MFETKTVKRRRVTAPGVNEPADGLSSNCFVVGDFVFITGLTARAPDGKPAATGDALQQAVIVFERMKALMQAAGGTMADIVKMNTYIVASVDPAEVPKMRAVRGRNRGPPVQRVSRRRGAAPTAAPTTIAACRSRR
jgi:enamine deaminase RidA (YjgF/YER057c/UK114 family)